MTYIDALLYDAPCKSECQPASSTFHGSTDFVYNSTRIFRPLIEHKEYYVSVCILLIAIIIMVLIKAAIKPCISLICSAEYVLDMHILTTFLGPITCDL